MSGAHALRMRDIDFVEYFELFVHGQRPATTPWVPVTDFSFEARKAIEGQHPQLIKDVFQPTHVLDAGCGRDNHLVKLLKELGVWAGGFDIDHPNPLWRVDLCGEIFFDEWCSDLVICREVLEHLTVKQIRQAVRNLVRLSSKYVYVTTRFHPSPSHLLDVQDHDDLDPTHITLLNKEFLRLLFVLEGCTSRPDLEERMDWKKLGRVLVFEVT